MRDVRRCRSGRDDDVLDLAGEGLAVFHEILGFLQAKTHDLTHDLDGVDLVATTAVGEIDQIHDFVELLFREAELLPGGGVGVLVGHLELGLELSHLGVEARVFVGETGDPVVGVLRIFLVGAELVVGLAQFALDTVELVLHLGGAFAGSAHVVEIVGLAFGQCGDETRDDGDDGVGAELDLHVVLHFRSWPLR